MSDAVEREFAETFWPEWPNKKAKKDALKAFRAARKAAPLDVIMAGVREYKANKEDWRAWMMAGTFLRGERWEDEYADQPQQLDWWERTESARKLQAQKLTVVK